MDPLAVTLRRLARHLPPAPVIVGAAFMFAFLAVALATGQDAFLTAAPFFMLGSVLELPELGTLRSKEELTDLQKQVRERMTEIHTAHGLDPLNDTERDEWSKLNATDDEISKRVVEYDKRTATIERIAGDPARIEREDDSLFRDPEARGSVKERDIYDLSTIRADLSNPTRGREQLHERAKRAIELAQFPLTRDRKDTRVYGFSTDDARAHVEGLLDRDNDTGDFSRYLLATGDPAYRRAWTKAMNAAQRGVSFVGFTGEEQRALERAMAAERALSTGSTGIPIPFQLDPTVVPTSNSVVNPWRAICRTEQVVVKEWRGVTSGAITAAYAAESVEATDNTPTLAQPVVPAHRAQAFVPFSIESDADWGQLQAEMARLLADAKDDLESAKFFSGGGVDEPTGLNAMSAATDVETAGIGAFVIGDWYKLEEAVAPRFRPRSVVAGNRAIYNKVRQFDTAGGAGLWLRIAEALRTEVIGGNTGAEIGGYGAYESSQMLAAVAAGNRILAMGDFRYYLIVDRVGMSIEVIPHLFGAANRFPTGQRGLYAHWRNGGKSLSENAFKFLKVRAV